MSMEHINEIEKVRVYEKIANPFFEEELDASVIEIFADHIATYKEKAGTRERYDVEKLCVESAIIKSFFEVLYSFIRTADTCRKTKDDKKHIVTITYNGFHKEIFEGATLKGEEELSWKIKTFVLAQQGKEV